MCADKTALRKTMLSLRATQSNAERTDCAAQMVRQILTLPVYQQAKTVFCYCATAQEFSMDALLSDALKQGKQVCVPRCECAGIMSARQIHSLDELQQGKFGIREPEDSSPIIRPEQIDLCIVPCLCADQDGYRLGYGGGYYDRFLVKTTAYTVLVCAAARLLSNPLPREATDIPCDCIVTERQVHR
nr:5-formyltetrahydrofolate cyclo-ligase [uncultured Butyricicoccus sp.]